MNTRSDAWNASYERGENYAFYPKEETVKFLNRSIRKRTGVETFRDILTPPPGRTRLRGLDFGCGIGRHVALFEEFGVEAHGVEISRTSLDVARRLLAAAGQTAAIDRLRLVDGESPLPFEAGYFDFATACGVLDSMPFALARRCVAELDRVVRSTLFVDLISGDDSNHHLEFAGETVVETPHERDTIQSYFNFERVRELFADTRFEIRSARLMTEQSLTERFRYSRYHVTLEKRR